MSSNIEKKHEWAGHMDSTIGFSQDYTSFKLVGYILLLPFSFPSFFPFPFLFFSKLALAFVLGSYTFIIWFF